MKDALRIAFLILVSFLLMNAEALAFRCGPRLVFIGDSKWDVLRKCGQPDDVEVWVEKRIEPYYSEPFSSGQRFYVPPSAFASVLYVTVQQWIYNLGPNQFIRILTFENNRLIRIDSGDYGY